MRSKASKRQAVGKPDKKGQKRRKSQVKDDEARENESSFFLDDDVEDKEASEEEEEEVAETAEEKRLRLGDPRIRLQSQCFAFSIQVRRLIARFKSGN